MKSLVQNNNTPSLYSKLYSWGKLLTITGGAQAIVQATGLLSGIIVIRLLPTQEYALYTLANTMLGTMTNLADGGIATGVMSQGGKVWNDKERLGEVLATGLDLRRKFAVGSLLIAIPILVYLLLHHDASWLATVLITLSLIPAFFAALSDSLLEIVPKLHQNIGSLQRNQITVSITRLFLNGVMLFLFPFTFIAVLANGIPRIFGNIRLRRIAYQFVEKQQKPNIEIRRRILKIVKRILPGAIYFCMSGQITIWLISFYGKTKSIAELGALGRLSMLLTFFSVVFSTLVVPRFARLPENKKILLNRFLQIIISALFLCLCIVIFFWLFSEQILFILGKQYMGLGRELLLNITGSCIALVWAVVFGLYSSRGWILNPVVSISISILAIISGLYLFDISSMTGVLYLNIFIATVEFTYHTGYGLFKIINIK